MAAFLRLVVASALFSLVLAFPTGPPVQVCQNMEPVRHTQLDAVDLDRGYSLVAVDRVFAPGSEVSFRLLGPNQYRGLFLQVRNNGDIDNSVAVGAWNVPNGYRHIACPIFPAGSALGQNSRANKNTGVQEFIWTAPDSCENDQEFTARATVVQTFAEVQTDITLTLTCRNAVVIAPPPRTTEAPGPVIIVPPPVVNPPPPVVPPVLPFVPPPQSQCSFTDLNSIPQGYSNNFEDANNVLQSWEAIGVDFRWTRTSGRTTSLLTGPSAADEGSYYVYSEASSPAQPGQEAILQTAADLRGCFCLRFSHSQIVLGNSHTFIVEIGGNQVASINQPATEEWVDRSFQVDVPTFVRIRLLVRRGTNWLGDIGLDNVRITPGVC